MTIQGANAAIRAPLVVADGTASAAAVLFTATTGGAPWAVERRIEVENTSTGDELTVLIVASPADLTGKTTAMGRRVVPGKAWGAIVAGNLTIGIVGTASYNAILSDA